MNWDRQTPRPYLFFLFLVRDDEVVRSVRLHFSLSRVTLCSPDVHTPLFGAVLYIFCQYLVAYIYSIRL